MLKIKLQVHFYSRSVMTACDISISTVCQHVLCRTEDLTTRALYQHKLQNTVKAAHT